ncbi:MULTISPECIES: sulfur oxidation c-type cytochrome SoxX [Paracoccus]|jgi:sulfur-oxidizing protein SoxX|uniref:Monoheme cytochrome SoxX (Sulfur oxidation) n=1 Tax=Paracoccus denitrificans (strain Pd 1222) TaxID=318586 RepID=A1B9M0_PARDP|nr:MULTISPECIES: sulfur oxidation c-type cytochrome SoxX [Paracoccus]ABL72214.1 monoheme cytochrome SoxX (sulfur oxidation) [Paracoccus denitrificans PD1222]MBB4625867.1 sulfur-oxidizing protein SoxX [Paracoccus denitrificans]MCU7426969.1 sulfur oxidation c-type cytochrome SoxX [Paracoccus denitrificans]MDK8871824.1 sulfur oxidation c-type cytochrome SoxX [Paracoccus sp. SSJ]QAR28787.1 sulfur oxidation c-type cytochrome SoxX [Paracoccus denitrificans]
MSSHLWHAAVVAMAIATPAICETAPKDVDYAEGAVEASLTGVPGNPEEGVRVMTTNALGNCVACHQIGALPDVEFPGTIAPPLDGAADRWTEAQLRGIVANAKMTFEGTFMPAFYKGEGFVRPGDGFTGKAGTEPLAPILNAQQIEDVVAFLVTLKE